MRACNVFLNKCLVSFLIYSASYVLADNSAQQPTDWPEIIAREPKNLVLTKDPLWFAEDCLGAMARYRSGDATELPHAIAAAERLLRMSSHNSEGRMGWPYAQALTPAAQKCGAPGAIDAFSDDTCNPPETPYMLQTGYAVACLAEVGQVTNRPQFIEVATKAISDSWDLGFTDTTCPGSFNYFYSYDSNDTGRIVRNTNAAMGVGLVWLFDATGIRKYRDRALAIAKAEDCEVAGGNFGYFGMRDPRYLAAPLKEPRRIENHILHQVKFLQLVAEKFEEPGAKNDADQLLDAYLNCTETQCRPNNCAVWAVPADCRHSENIAPCIDPSTEDRKTACSQMRAKYPRLSGFQLYLMEQPLRNK